MLPVTEKVIEKAGLYIERTHSYLLTTLCGALSTLFKATITGTEIRKTWFISSLYPGQDLLRNTFKWCDNSGKGTQRSQVNGMQSHNLPITKLKTSRPCYQMATTPMCVYPNKWPLDYSCGAKVHSTNQIFLFKEILRGGWSLDFLLIGLIARFIQTKFGDFWKIKRLSTVKLSHWIVWKSQNFLVYI
jgi:hypothetical protein